MDRAEAQARLDRIRAFRAELDALDAEGVVALDDAARRAILQHHDQLSADLASRFDVDRDEGQRRMSRGMRAASLIGALALSAALVLFFYRIWGWLTIAAQMTVLVAAPVVALAATEIAHRRDRSGVFTSLAALVACAGIVLNLVMAGRIFAVTDSPHAFIVWAAFGLAVGIGYGLRLPFGAGVAAAIAGSAGEIAAVRGIEWSACFERPETWLPAAVLVAGGSMLVHDSRVRRFLPTARGVGIATVLIALWLLSIDESFSLLRTGPTTIKGFYQVLGFAVAAAAIGAGLRGDYPELVPIGAVALAIFLITKFYQWFWDWMPAYLFFGLVGLVAVSAILGLRRLRSRAGAQ